MNPPVIFCRPLGWALTHLVRNEKYEAQFMHFIRRHPSGVTFHPVIEIWNCKP